MDKFIHDWEQAANNLRNAGYSVDIDLGLPYISVTMANGESYFFQEHGADEMIVEAKEALPGVSIEDYFLVTSQDW